MTERAAFKNPEPSRESLTTGELEKILDLQNRILGEAVVSDDYQGLLSNLCTLAESFTPNSVATIMLFESGNQSLYVESAPSLDDEGKRAFNGLKVGEGSCGNAVFHGEPMYVCNTHTDARWANVVDVAQRFNIRACWAFPIRDEQGEPVGSFAISSFEERRPEGFHRVLLQVCASIAGVILARKAHVEARENWFAEQLKSSKLESLAVLAGGIAHDFNNLLGAMLCNLDLASERLADDGESMSYLAQAKLATGQARNLSQQLLTFSRGGNPVKKPNDIRAVIRESAAFALQGSNVKLEFTSDPSPFMLLCDSGQLGQAIQNLVINARQSMPRGGTVHISIESVQATDLSRYPDANGPYICIRIRDTGCGIDEDVIDKIFDPYFSTKTHGSGLGLALTYSIVRKHAGYVEVNSERNVGTEFRIYLPAPPLEQIAEPVNVPEPEQPSADGLAMVVDDDDLVRPSAASAMRYLGFEVLEAESGARALELCREVLDSGRTVDITIMDLTMPGGLDGIETMTQLHALDPGMLAIISSGYGMGRVMSSYREYGFHGALAKPYSLKDLESEVAKVLDDARQTQLAAD